MSQLAAGPRSLAGQMAGSIKKVKANIFDLPDSDDESTPLPNRAESAARLHTRSPAKRYTASTAPRKVLAASRQGSLPIVSEAPSHRLPQQSSTGTARPAAIKTSNRAVKSPDFEFPESSDEGSREAKVTFSSKVKFRKQSAKHVAARQSTIDAGKATGKSSTPARVPTKGSKTALQNMANSVHNHNDVRIKRPVVVDERMNDLSLPVRHVVKDKNSKTASQKGKMDATLADIGRKPKSVARTSMPLKHKDTQRREDNASAEIDYRLGSSNLQPDERTKPDMARPTTPQRTTKAKLKTPKQQVLWGELMEALDHNDSSAQVPPNTAMVSTSKKRFAFADHNLDSDNESSVPRKKKRLVAALKISQSVPQVEADDLLSSSDMDLGAEESDLELPNVAMDSQASQRRSQAHSGKATYSQQRSYLTEQTEDSMLDAMIEEMSQPVSRSLEVSQNNNFDPESEEDGSDEDGQPKSAHDLRAAGTKKRMLQDLESLISGVEDEELPTSSRRADMLELASSMLTSSVVDLILDHGMDRQLVGAFARMKDIILSFVTLCCMSLLVGGSPQSAVVRSFVRQGIMEKALEMLQYGQDVGTLTKERKTNMSGIAQKKVFKFKTAFLESSVWQGHQLVRVSPQVCALRLMELVLGRFSDLGGDENLLDEDRLLLVIGLLQEQQASSSPDSRAYNWLGFSILKSCSTGSYMTKRGPWTGRTIKAAISCCQIITQAESSCDHPTRLAILAFLINITNENTKSCEMIVTQSGNIGDALASDVESYFGCSMDSDDDVVILSLGVLINLAELSDAARQQILSESDDKLQKLVRLFGQQIDEANSDASQLAVERNVPYGYLALWLVNLCVNDAVRARIVYLMPDRLHLLGLAQAAESFAAAHQQTASDMTGDQTSQLTIEGQGGSGSQLTQVLGKLRAEH